VWLLVLIVVTATVLRHLRLTTTLPALPAAGRRLRRHRGELLVCAAATAASCDAAEDGEEDEAAHTGADADDDGFVVVDPGWDLAADGSASAAAVLAGAAAAALGAVEEVLLQAVADVGTELGRAAGNNARGRVAGVCVVALSVGAHHGLALLISRRALAWSTLEAWATIIAVCKESIGWANGRVAGADFLRVTIARASTADRTRTSELAVAATVLVGVVADGVVLVLAGRGVAAAIVAAAFCATAIALFIAFDNTITALLASDGLHVSVVAQAVRLDAVAQESTADVTDGAGREFVNARRAGGVHDVLSTGVASSRA
jgi:hypothetical protein